MITGASICEIFSGRILVGVDPIPKGTDHRNAGNPNEEIRDIVKI